MFNQSEKTVYKGKIIEVREQLIENHTWEKLYLKDGVVVFPFNEKGQIIFIKEKRPHESPSLRFKPVTGIIEPYMNIVDNANREMQEEIGLGARQLKHFFCLKSSGTINNSVHFVACRDLYAQKLPNPDGEDSIQGQEAIDINEFFQDLHSDRRPWGHYCLGLLRLKGQLELLGASFWDSAFTSN